MTRAEAIELAAESIDPLMWRGEGYEAIYRPLLRQQLRRQAERILDALLAAGMTFGEEWQPVTDPALVRFDYETASFAVVDDGGLGPERPVFVHRPQGESK